MSLGVLPATIVDVSSVPVFALEYAVNPPPWPSTICELEELEVMVLFSMVTRPRALKMPPPRASATLPDIVELTIERGSELEVASE